MKRVRHGGRAHGGAIADDLATWIGTCPNGHVHYRHNEPHGACFVVTLPAA